MCFVKTPKIEAAQAPAPPPPPPTEEPAAIEVAGEDKDRGEKSGRKALTIKRGSTQSRYTRGIVKKNPAVNNKTKGGM